MEITNEQYIEAIETCKRYLMQQNEFFKIQSNYTQFIKNSIVSNQWKNLEAPCNIKIIKLNRKSTLFKKGDILSIIKIKKTFWLHNQSNKFHRESIDQADLTVDDIYSCCISIYFISQKDNKEKRLQIYINQNNKIDFEGRMFEIIQNH